MDEIEPNETLIQFFEWYCPADGEHWNRFGDNAGVLASLGITGAWLPPAYKGTRGAFSEGYDVYDIYDLGEFDQKGSVRTKYGTKEQYLTAIRKAQAAGLKVYGDVVLNHMGGAEEIERISVRTVDPDNRLQFTSEPFSIDAFTKFIFAGRGCQYSSFVWDHRCFTGVDHAVGIEEQAIYSIQNEWGDWEKMSDTEKGNFDYLMLNDIETRNPAVRAELKSWGKWYLQTTGVDGVRLDAVKHINPQFFVEWLDFLREEVKANLRVIGEYWLSDDLPVLLKYLDDTGNRMMLFDAPLHHNLSKASVLKEKFDLRSIFEDTLVSARPQSAVTFVDNHDTQPLQSLEEFTEQWFKPHAYALILLRDAGLPCVFYPDLYSCAYQGKDQSTIEIPQLPELPQLLMARSENAYGKQTDYFDHPNCVGWVRSGIAAREQSGCVVMISNNREEHRKSMEMGHDWSGETLKGIFYGSTVTLDRKGIGEFVLTGHLEVWVRA